MTLARIFAPHLGREVVFGRKRPKRGVRVNLCHYLDPAGLPVPPPSCDYSAPAASVLANPYDNNSLGCCVIAGGYHVVGVETANAGSAFTASDPQIIADYGAIGGYVPGHPETDNGCDEVTALTYWMQHGFANGTKLFGFAALDPANVDEVKAACWLFENLYFGMELPDAWGASSNGFLWDVAGPSNPDKGHCVIGCGYTDAGVEIDTWGLLGTLTWSAVEEYCADANGGQLFVLFSPDQLAKGQTKAPNGVDWDSLKADLSILNGSAPAPVPQPTPPTPELVTLQGAQKCVSDALAAWWPAG